MRLFVLFATLLFLFSLAGAQQLELHLTGAGARAEGLGGAFIGVADDATAIVWNPAGLGQLERPEASAVVRFVGEKFQFENNLDSGLNEESDQSHFTFNFGSFAMPIALGTNNLVLAVAYQKQIDFYSKEETDTDAFLSEGGANTITPGVALRFGSVFAVGGSANFWLGSSEEESTDKTTVPETVTKNSYDFKGTNFVIGGMIDLSGLEKPVPLKFGATFRTPFDLDVTSGDFPDQKIKVQMPLMMGFGASFRIGDDFLIAADYEIRDFGDKKYQFYYQDQLSGEVNIADLDESLNQFRVGAEYLIAIGIGVIPIRGGYHNVPTVYADFDWTGTEFAPTEQVVGYGFSVGTGLITGAFALDAALSIDTYEQKFNNTSFNPDLVVTRKYTNSKISLSGIIYF